MTQREFNHFVDVTINATRQMVLSFDNAKDQRKDAARNMANMHLYGGIVIGAVFIMILRWIFG